MKVDKFKIAEELYKKIKLKEVDLNVIEEMMKNHDGKEIVLNTKQRTYTISCDHVLFDKLLGIIEEELKNSLLLLNHQFEAL